MAWQRGQDHDGLLEGIKLAERSSMKRQIAKLRNSHISEIGHRESELVLRQTDDCVTSVQLVAFD